MRMSKLSVRHSIVLSAGMILAMSSGCGGKPASETASPAASATPPAAPKVATLSATPRPVEKPKPIAGKATLVGHIAFNGEPPKRKVLSMGPEKKCHDQHKTPPTDESVIVSADKSLKNVLVRIVGDVPGDYPPPTEPAVIDQVGCIFIPHVLAVRTGQPVLIKNSDDVAHNVRLECIRNDSFNRIIPTKGDSMTVEFKKEDIGMKIRCDVHFWMSCGVHAIRHPFFSVTDVDGNFKIENLPPGEYKLEAHHESLGKQTRNIEAKDGEIFTTDFEFSPK